MLQFKTLGWKKEDETSFGSVIMGLRVFSGTWHYEASTGKNYPL